MAQSEKKRVEGKKPLSKKTKVSREIIHKNF